MQLFIVTFEMVTIEFALCGPNAIKCIHLFTLDLFIDNGQKEETRSESK
jgi:hypothetical protein